MLETLSSAENLEKIWLIHECHQNLAMCEMVSDYLLGRAATGLYTDAFIRENTSFLATLEARVATAWVQVVTASLAKLEAVVETVNSLHANPDQCAYVTAASIVQLEAVVKTVNSLSWNSDQYTHVTAACSLYYSLYGENRGCS